jgi:hypothetical protein
VPNEEGKTPGVIDVGVRQNLGIDLIDRYWQLKILFVALVPLALKETTVEHDRLSGSANDVT